MAVMPPIAPAQLKAAGKPDVPVPLPAEDASGRTIRGTALIVWDSALPGTKYGKKLDAIDTDQITPAADCVSESLDTLDERWKAGAFRYLVPDFRSRVHRGETFLVAGDRFAIGSSREMSPAGLKGIADEAGLELVVVCGRNMGDIFRRNALNLGLHVVQSPEAVADARDGDTFEFHPGSRRLVNVTQDRSYDPLPLTPVEDEIRRSGGIIAVGRRELRASIERRPDVAFPDAVQARTMTTTEQIAWAHRVDKARATIVPGDTLRLYADLLPASDGTAPFAIHTFNQITGGDAIFPRQAAIANDHFVFTGREDDQRQTAIGRAFAQAHDLQPPYYATPGDGIFHFYFPEQGLVVPGQFIPGADSHSRAYGAYGAVGIGVGSTTLGFGWATGYVYFTLAPARRVTFAGTLQPWVAGKDIVLELLRRWGAQQAQGMSVELVDGDRQLPMPYRNTIANMMAEAEAQNGIFAADAVTLAWYEARGIALTYPPPAAGADARYVIDETVSLSAIAPMIARPFSPGNAYPAADVARERITFDKALIGSCTNGSYDDLLQAALVLRDAHAAGVTRAVCPLVVFPGSGGVARRIEHGDPRLGGESIAGVFRRAGGEIRQSWCGPCFGQGPDALQRGERAITTFNRNWQNRMGVGGEGYLASPAVVAASALAGYMAPPSELGLRWDPERHGV
jgi:3-isopropylmalate/(R)-2-methylmalate dehydratase large subunit